MPRSSRRLTWVWVIMGILGAVTAAGWAYWIIHPPGPLSDAILFVLEVLWVIVNVALAVAGIRTLEKRK